MAIWIYPSGDIHLVTASNMTVGLRVVTQVPNSVHGAWSDASTVDGMNVLFVQAHKQPPAPGPTHAITSITGVHGPDPLVIGPAKPATVSLSATPGTSFHRVQVTFHGTPGVGSPPAPAEHFDEFGIIRVTTHADVSGLVAGDQRVSAFAGESDRVVTVYARFTDGSFEDVTGHPWLKYLVFSEAVATVDAEGRIHAVSPGTTFVDITTWDFRFSVKVQIVVRPAMADGLTGLVVDQLTRKTARHKTTLYVIAEGYKDDKRFFDQARQAVRALFKTSPYSRFADVFNAIGVFQPSPDQGLTIGPRVRPGTAADERALWPGQPDTGPLLAAPAERLFTRDTLFGLMAGARLQSSPLVGKWEVNDHLDEASFALKFMRERAPARTVAPDDRRLPRFGLDAPNAFLPVPPDAAFASVVERYLQAAGQTPGVDDRIAFLVDDEFYCGLKIDVLGIPLDFRPMVAISRGLSGTIHGVKGTAPLFDRDPLPPELDKFEPDQVGARLAHEIGHSYHLGDEYENKRKRSFNDDPADLEKHDNVQHDLTLRAANVPGPLRGDPTASPPSPPSPPDVTRIKWNIHRIAKLSAARSVAPAGVNLRLTVDAGQELRWTVGEPALIRNSLATPKDTKAEPRTTAVAVQVVATDTANHTIDVRPPAAFDPKVLGEVPILYLPKRLGGETGTPLTLIDPIVLNFLGTQGPFPKPASSPCTGPVATPNADQPVPGIPPFQPPRNRADAIGLYEGAEDISCDVYRPAGRCKMRNLTDSVPVPNQPQQQRVAIVDFCFVCKYILVELNDPSQHERLDGEYPR